MAPSREICETLQALTGADVCDPAQALLDAGGMYGDAETAALGALLTFTRKAAGPGFILRLAKQERAVAEAAGKTSCAADAA